MARSVLLIGCIAGLLAAGCFPEHETYYFSEKEIERLLSGDSMKIWIRTAQEINDADIPLEGCEKYRYLAFAHNPRNIAQKFYASFQLSGDCIHGSDSIIVLDSGNWKVLSNPQLKALPDTLALYDSTVVKYLQTIDEVSISKLTISRISSQNGAPDILIRELYESNDSL